VASGSRPGASNSRCWPPGCSPATRAGSFPTRGPRFCRSIASLDRLKRKENKRLLLENRKWDLIIFDEAHRLSAVNYGRDKTHKTDNYKLAEAIRLQEYSEAFLFRS